jgi:hypothetical protein
MPDLRKPFSTIDPKVLAFCRGAQICPTDCDDDCEADCHEWHQPHARRDHQPDECTSVDRTTADGGEQQ